MPAVKFSSVEFPWKKTSFSHQHLQLIENSVYDSFPRCWHSPCKSTPHSIPSDIWIPLKNFWLFSFILWGPILSWDFSQPIGRSLLEHILAVGVGMLTPEWMGALRWRHSFWHRCSSLLGQMLSGSISIHFPRFLSVHTGKVIIFWNVSLFLHSLLL